MNAGRKNEKTKYNNKLMIKEKCEIATFDLRILNSFSSPIDINNIDFDHERSNFSLTKKLVSQ